MHRVRKRVVYLVAIRTQYINPDTKGSRTSGALPFYRFLSEFQSKYMKNEY